ncbi:MAG: DNA double-strand break repair nuclease NurA [Betaproteobacteria bacterium]|nr:DNA double-strand break repair nuclease NurA [Betaproteobacteria bacterium]
MPFKGEAPSYRAIQRLATNPRVKELLGAIRVPEWNKEKVEELVAARVAPSEFLPRLVVAIDGSSQAYEPRKGFPGAELAYLTVSTVIIDVSKLSSLSQQRDRQPPPTEYRRIENAESLDTVLPGCNVIFRDEPHAWASFRRALYEALEQQKGWEGCENLLATYEVLLAHRQQPSSKCPWEECAQPDGKHHQGFGIYSCACGERKLYSTDALRIHEGINPVGSSGKAFGEVMQILERLRLIHVLRMIEKKNLLPVLSQIAFVVDGPLAVYGHPAWLSQSIYQELRRINQILRQRGLPDLLIVGIEKTGIFADHLMRLDQDDKGVPDRLPRQSAFFLTDRYIKKNIIFSSSPEQYGKQTYFGRKFFYKTRAGSLLVAAVPFLDPVHHDISTARPDQYPRLADALNLLDCLETTRYPNALIPLTAAHAEATLPMNIGRRVLERLAEELVGGKNG